MIFYVENSRKFILKKHNRPRTNKLIKVTGYKKTYKNQLFFCILAVNMWTVTLKISLTVAPKNWKIFRYRPNKMLIELVC